MDIAEQSASLPTPSIQFVPFAPGALEGSLGFSAPLFSKKDVSLLQLRYLYNYASQLDCKCFAIETGYIDRDFMEDFSVFYSKCFAGYPNHCRRVHFFSRPEEEVRRGIESVMARGQGGEAAYKEASRGLSEELYLGFSVIKPLDGSPVGRTVLKCFPRDPGDPSKKFTRVFDCARDYIAHFLGVEFTVRGLGFQQQDIGVSACATTAVWSALQKIRDHQHIASFTPAQITTLASKYSLPFGRSMPSEGLSIDQMCQAVQAMGVSPNVYRAERMEDCRSYLYAAIRSAFPPILILNKSATRDFHAVAVVGMKLEKGDGEEGNKEKADMRLSNEKCNNMTGIYIHDDRRGPYLRASIVPKDSLAQIHVGDDRPSSPCHDVWDLKHVIIPTPSKIRTSMSVLKNASLHVVSKLHAMRDLIDQEHKIEARQSIDYEYWVIRSHKYIEELVINARDYSTGLAQKIGSSIPMSRHIGLISVSGGLFDQIDVLVDVTGTQRNAHCLGVCAKSTRLPLTKYLVRELSKDYRCAGVA